MIGLHFFTASVSKHTMRGAGFYMDSRPHTLPALLAAFFIIGGCAMNAHAHSYPKLDSPEVLQFIFHSRKEAFSAPPRNAVDYVISAAEDARLYCRFYLAEKESPCILFFHGNGEIAGDYDDLGPMYNSYGISLLAADYRGYGQSTGSPTIASMMHDCHSIFKEVQRWRKDEGRTGPLFVMGRSLGSASALEIASSYQSDIAGLIIESGFAYTVPLLNFLGADTRARGITEADALLHIEKIKRCARPTLILHAQFDQFIPLSDAQALLKHSPALKKYLKVIPGADHNTILLKAGKSYFETIKNFISGTETF